MRRQMTFLFTLVIWLASLNSVVIAQQLERLSYNNRGLLVDLGVGFYAWPLPTD